MSGKKKLKRSNGHVTVARGMGGEGSVGCVANGHMTVGRWGKGGGLVVEGRGGKGGREGGWGGARAGSGRGGKGGRVGGPCPGSSSPPSIKSVG